MFQALAPSALPAVATAQSDAAPTATAPLRDARVPTPFHLTTDLIEGPNQGARGLHAHPEGMLIWPARGSVVVVVVDGSLRTVSVGQGLWVPAFASHAMQVDASSIGCSTSFSAEVAPAWPSVGHVQLSTALRELLLHLAQTPMPDDQRLRAQRVVVELLPDATSYVESVPVPRDTRIRPLVRLVMDDPADDRGLEAWAWQLSLSVRTIARIFSNEIGMTFSAWRTMVRMACATKLLAESVPVGTVAHRVGYATTSAFSAAFRRSMGVKPSDWPVSS